MSLPEAMEMLGGPKVSVPSAKTLMGNKSATRKLITIQWFLIIGLLLIINPPIDQ